MERTPKKLARYMTGDHFAAVYNACDVARHPKGHLYPPADWWRALVVTGYMTGWRISDILGLRREDVDLDAGVAVTRWDQGKGKRDDWVRLHPVVVEHLRRLADLTPTSSRGTCTGAIWKRSGTGSRRRPGSTSRAGPSTSTPRRAATTASTTCGGPSRR
jgi:integrase